MNRAVHAHIYAGSEADARAIRDQLNTDVGSKNVIVAAPSPTYSELGGKWVIIAGLKFQLVTDADSFYNSVVSRLNSTSTVTQRLSPDAILTQTNLTGALAIIQDDPDSPDLGWMEATDNAVNTDLRISFPSPAGRLAAGLSQEMRVLVRKSALLGAEAAARLEVLENGSVRRASGDIAISSDVGTVLNLTFWDTDLIDPFAAGLELRVVGIATTKGKAADKRVIDVGAVECNVSYSVSLYQAGSRVMKHDCDHDEAVSPWGSATPARKSNFLETVK